MATLSSLPYDIKHLLLRQIEDRDTLITLVSASKTFFEVFSHHKESILHSIHVSEALSYAPDSLVFTFCRRNILEIDNLDTLVDTINGYQTLVKTGTLPYFLNDNNTPSKDRHSRQWEESLVDDYLGIRKIAVAHQYPLRNSRNEPPLTASELRRIIQALYRGWTLLLLLHQRTELEPRRPEYLYRGSGENGYDNYALERLITTWDIWDVIRIQVVMGENLRVLPTGKIDVRDSAAIAFGQFEGDVSKSGLKELVERCAGGERMVFVTPLYSMADPSTATKAAFALATQFSQYLFIHHYPATIAHLYTLKPTPGAKTVYDRMAAHLPFAVEGYLNRRSSNRGIHTFMSVDTLQYIITKLLGWYNVSREGIGFEGMEVKGMRLMEENVDRGNEKVFPQEARWAGRHAWIKRAKVNGCVFDEWRLGIRGLQWPVFEE